MKESSCGRIISQRKLQSSLLKQYDTKHTINFARIAQLKNKYLKQDKNRSPLAPLVNLTNTQKNDDSTYVSQFTNQIKQKYGSISHIKKNFEERKNVTGGGSEGIDIGQYKKKVEIMDQGISRKLDSIEEELAKLKNLRQLKEKIQIERNYQIEKIKYIERIKETQKLIELERLRRADRQSQILIKLPQSMKVSQVQQDYQVNVNDIQRSIVAKLDAKLLKRAQQIDESKCKLLGQFKKQRHFSNQFTIFINRLKDQISLDIDFTLILLSLPRRDRQAVKEYIKKYHSSADIEFFNVLPIQQDPLQTEAKVSYNGSIQSIAEKMYEFYLKIQDHYKLKLANNFQLDTVQTLFWEIGEKQMTLGHLISYINMRTGKDFRNRALVKLLRRLGISNHIIDLKTFSRGFVKF